VTSLNQAVAKIDANQHIVPVSYGKVDILADVKIGESTRSEKLRAYIVDKQQWKKNGLLHLALLLGFGIGIGDGTITMGVWTLASVGLSGTRSSATAGNQTSSCTTTWQRAAAHAASAGQKTLT
jgi:hypothetical protein